MKKLLLTGLILLAGLNLSYAQRAVIINSQVSMSIEQSMSFNSARWFTIYVDLEIFDAVNKPTTVMVYFYDENGNPLKDYNKSYYTSTGNVCVTKKVTPYNNQSIFRDLRIKMPTKELHISKSGDIKLQYAINVICDNKWIDEGRHTNTFTYQYHFEKCPHCSNGACPTCNGRWQTMIGNHLHMCNGCTGFFGASPGRCRYCLGNNNGNNVTKDHIHGNPYLEGERLDEVGGRATQKHVAPLPPISTKSRNNSTKSGGSSTRSGSNVRNCASCNGTGTVVRDISSSQFGIRNEVKVRCPKCNKLYFPSTGHSHITCTNCKGTGKVRY